jgi:hypothetical protein
MPHRVERLALHLQRLVSPCVAGRAEGEVGRPVRIGEVPAIAHANGTVVATGRGSAMECAGRPVQRRGVRPCLIFPFAFRVQHESDAIDALAVALVDRFGMEAFVSRINSSKARRKAARRGRDTLVPHCTWLEQGWPTGQRTRPPAEFLFRCRLSAEAPHLIDVFPAYRSTLETQWGSKRR